MTRDELLAVSREPNVRAFLDVLAACEGTAGPNGYRTLFGGGTFASFAKHPGIVIDASLGGKPLSSTAAGRYQFLSSTWRALAGRYGFPSFEPDWQDAGAVALIAEKPGALDDLRAGRLDDAVAKVARVWASLPGSPYGQPTKHPTFVRDVFVRAGGRLDGGAPIEARTQPEPVTIGVRLPAGGEVPEEGPANGRYAPYSATPPAAAPTTPPAATEPPTRPAMSPFLVPALSALAELVPSIAKLFRGESPSRVAERNVSALELLAEKLVPILLAATGAPNLQGVVERVQADPTARSAVDEAVQAQYWRLLEASEKSTAAARDFAVAYAQARDVRTVVGRLTFLELLTLVLLAISASLTGWLIYAGLLVGELLGAVVTLVVVAGFVDVRKFWLGLPAPDQPRDPRA